MLHHALRVEMFNPSTSWISKAGVKLEYTPEDTLKSVIFPQCDLETQYKPVEETHAHLERNEDKSQSCAGRWGIFNRFNGLDQLNFDAGQNNHSNEVKVIFSCKPYAQQDDCAASFRENPDGAPVHETNDGFNPTEAIPTGLKTGSTRRKPVPFLKRRQGIAAWCSKMRRQGIHVTDPSEGVLKKQSTPPNKPTKLKTIHSFSKPSRSDKNFTNPSQDNPPASHPEMVRSPRLSTTLWCGPPLVKVSGDHPVTNTENPNQSNLVVSKLSQPFDVTKVANEQASILSSFALGNDDARADAADLEEFELLEEIAETSSFSSLTNSFVAKLGKTNLRERLAQAENQAKRLNLLSKTKDMNSESNQLKKSSSTGSVQSESVPVHLNHDQTNPDLKPSATNFNSHSSSDLYNQPEEENFVSNCRSTQGILASSRPNGNRKIARFRMAETTKPTDPTPLTDWNSYNRDNDDPELEAPNVEINLSRSYDFDDTSSWNQSAYEESPDKLSKDMSGLTINNGTTPSATAIATTAMTMKVPSADQEPKHINLKPNHFETGDRKPIRVTTQDVDKRVKPTSLSRSASLRSNSLAQFKGSNSSIPSYEEELANLADEFIGKLRREPQSPGRLNINSAALLRQWISRLEAEVKRFKIENNHLNKMRTEREEGMRRLEQETKRFEDKKAKEMKQLNEMKEAEMRKIKKERRVLEEYQRALKSMPNKKDRDEIERLKEELNEARSDLSRREARWHAAISRLRSRIEELELERDDLKSRVSRIEEERVRLQSQLAKLQTTSDTSKPSVNGMGSSLGKQTLNSVSQSVNLNPSRPDSTKLGDATSRTTNTSEKHLTGQTNTRCHAPVSGRLTAPMRSMSMGSRRPNTEMNPPTTGPATSTSIANAVATSGTSPTLSKNNAEIERACGSARREVSNPQNNGPSNQGVNDKAWYIQKSIKCGDSTLNFDRKSSVDDLPDKLVGDDSLTVQSKTAYDSALPQPGTAAFGTVIRSVKHPDGSVEETYSNGAVIIAYSNGSVKEIFPDGITIVVSLFNGDLKRTLPDGRVRNISKLVEGIVKFFEDFGTEDVLNIIRLFTEDATRAFVQPFTNCKIYHYAADGTVQTTYPDGVEEITYADGRQETIRPMSAIIAPPRCSSQTDPVLAGSLEQTVRQLPNGDKEILLPNGQREIHSTSGIKCRIYPDGTIKTVFPDGRHETRYSSGRLRVKDSEGNLILDTRLPLGSVQTDDKVSVQTTHIDSTKATTQLQSSSNQRF